MLTSQHVSVRGTGQVFAALHLPVTTRQQVVDARRAMGRASRRPLARACEQLRARVTCLAGDDTLFHRSDVKVLMELASGAVLDVMGWPWHGADDWHLWIEGWPSLLLFVSDLGTDLTVAARRAQIVHQADLFHERQWRHEKLFMPLPRHDQQAARVVLQAWDRATRVEGSRRRVGPVAIARAEAERSKAEEQRFAAVRAEEQFRTLLEPLDPCGARWPDEVLDTVCEHLVSVPRDIGSAAWMHVHSCRARRCAPRVLWDAIGHEPR